MGAGQGLGVLLQLPNFPSSPCRIQTSKRGLLHGFKLEGTSHPSKLGFPLGGAASPLMGWCASHLGPGGTQLSHFHLPSSCAHSRNPPEPSRTFQTFQNVPELSETQNFDFLYMNLILRTLPDLIVMSWIPSETLNKLRFPNLSSYLLTTTSNLKRVTLRFANYADMVETTLRPITNSGIWRSIMAPTYSTMIQ